MLQGNLMHFGMVIVGLPYSSLVRAEPMVTVGLRAAARVN